MHLKTHYRHANTSSCMHGSLITLCILYIGVSLLPFLHGTGDCIHTYVCPESAKNLVLLRKRFYPMDITWPGHVERMESENPKGNSEIIRK
jgi:hypothetical protein